MQTMEGWKVGGAAKEKEKALQDIHSTLNHVLDFENNKEELNKVVSSYSQSDIGISKEEVRKSIESAKASQEVLEKAANGELKLSKEEVNEHLGNVFIGFLLYSGSTAKAHELLGLWVSSNDSLREFIEKNDGEGLFYMR